MLVLVLAIVLPSPRLYLRNNIHLELLGENEESDDQKGRPGDISHALPPIPLWIRADLWCSQPDLIARLRPQLCPLHLHRAHRLLPMSKAIPT